MDILKFFLLILLVCNIFLPAYACFMFIQNYISLKKQLSLIKNERRKHNGLDTVKSLIFLTLAFTFSILVIVYKKITNISSDLNCTLAAFVNVIAYTYIIYVIKRQGK